MAGNLKEIMQAVFVGPNGERMTADQIARRREIASSLLSQATDTSPNAGGWASVLAKGAMGLSHGLGERRMDAAAKRNLEADSAIQSGLVSGALGIPSSGSGVAQALVAADPAVSVPSGEMNPMSAYQNAIASIESAGSGDYAAIGPSHPNLGRALGRYQVMEANIKPWSLKHLGREITAEEFMNNPALQDQIFNGEFGSYVNKYGPEGAAQAWFGGEGGVGKLNRKDSLGTSIGGYTDKFRNALGSAPSQISPISPVEMQELPPVEGAEFDAGRFGDPINLSEMPAGPDTVAQRLAEQVPVQPVSPVSAALVEPAQQPYAGGSFPAAPLPPAMAPNMPAAPQLNPAVMDAINDPYASPQTKQMAMAEVQRYQQSQQAYQQKIAARQQQAAQLQQQEQIAGSLGIDPMYARDENVWKAAIGDIYNTPTDVREYEYNLKNPGFAEFQQQKKRAGATNITNNMGGEKFSEEFGKNDAKLLADVDTAGIQASRNLARIDQLGNVLSNVGTGGLASVKQLAGEFGIKTEGSSDIEAAQALVNSLVPEQRQPGSGPMSDADLALFKQSLPRIINTPEGNRMIVNTMRGIAQYDAEGAAIVQQLRSGDIDRTTAFRALRERQNPLASFKVSSGESTGSAQPKTTTSTGVKWSVE